MLIGAAQQARAQVSFSYRDINPNQSSLDATDADGASGGRVNGLARAPNGTTFFAASEWGGLYFSTDTGQTWAHVPGHFPMATWDVEVDPSNGNRVYATSFYDGRVNSRAGISVSTDGGVTWTHPASATPAAGFCDGDDRRDNPGAFGIAIDPANTNHVVIGTNCGVARSTDAGVNWTFIDPTPADGADDVWDVVVHDGGIIDVCGDDGHRRSTDNGVTWVTATSSPIPGGRCSLAVSPDEGGVLY
ncbi:MAG: WD40/YVTN/BNR-like repeat-containing protein, partial [Longimicrobiales bacterium]